MNTTTPTPPALLHLRLLAAIYDLFPLLPIWFFSAALCLLITRGDLNYHSVWFRVLLFGVTAAYFIGSWARGGQTIGLKAWRLRVVSSDQGKPLTFARASLRFLVALISLGGLGLGFFWAFFDPQKRTWHDRAARTHVVRLPK